jgi:hypothetical protein
LTNLRCAKGVTSTETTGLREARTMVVLRGEGRSDGELLNGAGGALERLELCAEELLHTSSWQGKGLLRGIAAKRGAGDEACMPNWQRTPGIACLNLSQSMSVKCRGVRYVCDTSWLTLLERALYKPRQAAVQGKVRPIAADAW